jgi:hypothetical protein
MSSNKVETKPTSEEKTPMYSEEEQKTMKKHMKTAVPVITAGFATFIIITALVLCDKFNFTKLHGTTASDIQDYQSQLKFVFQQQTLSITWILVSIFYVSYKRGGSPAMDPTAGYERVTLIAKNNLANSVEQFLLSSVSQVILVSYISPEMIVNAIPACNLLFIVGRIAFLIGYPMKRGFGYSLTILPTIVIMAYNLYKFIRIYTY